MTMEEKWSWRALAEMAVGVDWLVIVVGPTARSDMLNRSIAGIEFSRGILVVNGCHAV
jgi:hypothetical protein